MNKLIVYTGEDETIVTTLEQEHLMLTEYFVEGGRKLDEYDRQECANGIFAITYNVSFNIDF